MRLLLGNSGFLFLIMVLIAGPASAGSISLWSAFEAGKGVMKEKEDVEAIKGKDLLKAKLYWVCPLSLKNQVIFQKISIYIIREQNLNTLLEGNSG
jgi:hypothetical protein